MVRRRQRERSVRGVVLPDARKLWPAALRRIDQLIDDDALVEVIAAAWERRYPTSRRRGRPGTPAEVAPRDDDGAAAAGRHDGGGDEYPPSDGQFAVGRLGSAW